MVLLFFVVEVAVPHVFFGALSEPTFTITFQFRPQIVLIFLPVLTQRKYSHAISYHSFRELNQRFNLLFLYLLVQILKQLICKILPIVIISRVSRSSFRHKCFKVFKYLPVQMQCH